ncbi:hypothetical protein H5410_031965 [Solanum commersonii]|uniref:Uncharacterized protein n=1 Tax=Solanum commersonii TaxID=4109 RepID=A0A9J5YIM8_SOLCO|nr:hypothetical protein H5410_031965 [Solanum commersonii]
MAKMAYFQGETSPIADIGYGTSWSPWRKQPNFKVKRAHTSSPYFFGIQNYDVIFAKTTHFHGQTSLRANNPPILYFFRVL